MPGLAQIRHSGRPAFRRTAWALRKERRSGPGSRAGVGPEHNNLMSDGVAATGLWVRERRLNPDDSSVVRTPGFRPTEMPSSDLRGLGPLSSCCVAVRGRGPLFPMTVRIFLSCLSQRKRVGVKTRTFLSFMKPDTGSSRGEMSRRAGKAAQNSADNVKWKTRGNPAYRLDDAPDVPLGAPV